jgi:hypothetical protein
MPPGVSHANRDALKRRIETSIGMSAGTDTSRLEVVGIQNGNPKDLGEASARKRPTNPTDA